MEYLFALSDFATVASAAGSALVGAAVGGAITAWAMRSVEVERREHQAAREQRTDLALLRAAARLQADVFMTALAVVRQAMKRGDWGGPLTGLLVPPPLESRMLIAQHTTDEAWDSINDAEMEVVIIAMTLRDEPGTPIEDSDADETIATLQDAIRRLDILAEAEELMDLDLDLGADAHPDAEDAPPS